MGFRTFNHFQNLGCARLSDYYSSHQFPEHNVEDCICCLKIRYEINLHVAAFPTNILSRWDKRILTAFRMRAMINQDRYHVWQKNPGRDEMLVGSCMIPKLHVAFIFFSKC